MCVSANHPARKINQRDTLAPVLFNNLLCDTARTRNYFAWRSFLTISEMR